MKKFDVIIIGGGVVGSAIARELSRYKIKTALLEKEAELAFGVSKSNSGIIHPGTQNPPGSLKGKLCVEGNRLVRKTAKELGIDFKQTGELIVAFNKNDKKRLQKIKSDAELLGVAGLKIVDKKWLKHNEPNLSDKVCCALYAPSAGVICPYRFVYDMSENAAENGVKILTETEVKSIKIINNNNFEIITPGEVYKSRYIINAAGLYADEVADMAGAGGFKITPRKGEEYILDKKQENIANHLIFPLPSEKSKGTLIIKTSDSNPMVGPTAKEIDDKQDTSTSAAGIEEVFNSVKKMMPSINKNDVIAYFAGLRPASGNDFIIRHEDKVPGFINAAGIQSPGLTAAPAIAKMVIGILKSNGLKLIKKQRFNKYRTKTTHLFAIPLAKTKELVKKNPEYGDIVCRCEMISASEIRQAVKRGAKTLDGVKFRTRAQAGRCHGGFCTSRIMKILAQELGVDITKVTKKGKGSEVVTGKLR